MKLDHAAVSRKLLKDLRDIMAEGGTVENRLDKVVKLIAEKMNTEVCSCYVMRAGEVLELFATEGLKKEAVHNTRLRVGEGLVGLVAENQHPVALADAWSHPRFAYRPETGEDFYRSLLGVPLVSGKKILGVLVVQNNKERIYSEVEIETLETVAMVLSEMLSSGNILDKDTKRPADGMTSSVHKEEGLSLSAGIGIGKAVVHKQKNRVAKLIAEDREEEKEKLSKALDKMNNYLDEMFSASKLGEGEHLEIIETYKMFAKDKGWVNKIHDNINNGLTAEASVQRVYDDMWFRLSASPDSYLKERLHDFKDLTERLMDYLYGDDNIYQRVETPEHAIIIAQQLGPAELLDYDVKKVRGIVLVEGTPTLHVAIIARALNIPVVSKIKDIIETADEADDIIVDGNHGQVFVRPSEDIKNIFYKRFEDREKLRKTYATLRDKRTETVDETRIELNINAGLVADLDYLHENNADGIGLYRTEIPFMIRTQMPTVETQMRLYSSILDRAGNKPVIFRTLDVGADKLLSYWDKNSDENPAMGWRSLRITLDRRAILRQQLRAFIRSAKGKELFVMFPMVSECSEFEAAKEALDKELEREARFGADMPKKVSVGTMLEVPSIAFQLDAILKRVDFVSIGTNDLMQFFFASDRGNPKMANRYDYLSPAFLQFLKMIVNRCNDLFVPCSVCGEMAGDPLGAMALLAVGFRKLSVSGASYGLIKSTIRSLNLDELEVFVDSLLKSSEHSLRSRLKSYALDHNIKI